MNVQQALSVVSDPQADPNAYLAACEEIVKNRNALSYPVFIHLPGGLSGNADPVWEKVKAGSEGRCACGNERVIKPSDPRTEFEDGGTRLTVSSDVELYLKPLGGDKASTWVSLRIEQGALTYLPNPFAPLVFSLDIFSTQGFLLAKLAEVLPKRKPPVFKNGDGIPIFAILAIDLENQSVQIGLDAAVESFDPDTAEAVSHVC